MMFRDRLQRENASVSEEPPEMCMVHAHGLHEKTTRDKMQATHDTSGRSGFERHILIGGEFLWNGRLFCHKYTLKSARRAAVQRVSRTVVRMTRSGKIYTYKFQEPLHMDFFLRDLQILANLNVSTRRC
jgi:hypothetical protein